MTSAKHLLRLLTAGLGSAWVATACVRLQEPDYFVCNADSDCADAEKCAISGHVCVSKDFCSGDYDCPAEQHCTEQQRCVADECTTETEPTACNGYVCSNGSCEKACSFRGCAHGFHCETETCLPGDPLANGKACSTSTDCASLRCCEMPGGSVCSASVCPKKVGQACSQGYECASGNCCADRNGSFGCTSTPCNQSPECLGDDDCFFEQVCVQQKCVAPATLKSTGDACLSSAECASGSCVKGICRGAATAGDVCYTDADCEANRLCCKPPASTAAAVCGELDRGCVGSIGDACVVFDECVGRNCSIDGFCTKKCTQNSDCGTSPWGVPNACETDSFGSKTCFPGCTSSQQCLDNLEGDFVCLNATEGKAKFCTLP